MAPSICKLTVRLQRHTTQNAHQATVSHSTISVADRSLSVIMPALNEAANLANAVEEVRKVAAAGDLRYEIIIIDDGSTDGTGPIADRMAQQDPRVRVVHHSTNLGLGAAYRRGAEEARMNYVMLVPGDNAHPAPGILPIVEAIGPTDVVVMYPQNPEVRPVTRRILSRVYTFVLNFLFQLRVPYYNGLNVYRASVLRKIDIETNSFGYSSEILIKLLSRGHSFACIGTRIEERSEGSSKALRIKNVSAVVFGVICLWVKIQLKRT